MGVPNPVDLAMRAGSGFAAGFRGQSMPADHEQRKAHRGRLPRGCGSVECGGKRSATPLWLPLASIGMGLAAPWRTVLLLESRPRPMPAAPPAKAPSPLRSAGALHTRLDTRNAQPEWEMAIPLQRVSPPHGPADGIRHAQPSAINHQPSTISHMAPTPPSPPGNAKRKPDWRVAPRRELRRGQSGRLRM